MRLSMRGDGERWAARRGQAGVCVWSVADGVAQTELREAWDLVRSLLESSLCQNQKTCCSLCREPAAAFQPAASLAP